MLQRERDWCHARAPLSLPRPLAEVARGAGLRWEGLTYSYLALTHPEEQSARSSAGWWRLLSRALRSKGKTEWMACGAHGQTRLVLRDRHRSAANAALEKQGQGDLVRLPQTQTEAGRQRILPETCVEVD